MGKGRLDGEGSVYQRKSDGRWVASVSLGRGVDGKRRRRVVYGATRAEALRKRDEVKASVAAGVRVQTRRPGTLDAYLETWISVTLRHRVMVGDLRESTRATYADKLRRYVVGTRLGGLPLEEIRPADVREWLAWLSARRTARKDPATGSAGIMSPGGVRLVYRVLRAALNDAVDDEILVRSPAATVKPPKARKPKADPLPLADAVAVLEAARGDRLEALWIVFLYLGLRHGEALALRWDDVDLEGGRVRVHRSAGWIRDPEELRRVLVEGDTVKTDASDGFVPLPAVVATALEEHRSRQRRERLAAPVWVRRELVFSSEAGTLLDNSNVRRAWVALCRRAGVTPRRIHDLRHTTGSLLLLAGVPVEVISVILRHESPAITAEIYAHVFDELPRGALDKLAALMAGGS